MAWDTKILELDYSEKISIEKCVFSHEGKLIAIHHSCQVLLLNCEGKFLCSVFKVIEECEYTVPCLTFSTDDSLLLFCIQKITYNQTFYVWDVKKKVLTDPMLLPFPHVIDVDCCCFSSDNSKLFFCNASSVLILEYPSKVVSCPTIIVPHVNSGASDTCSHCIVSSDNMLLAWCVANEIFIFSLNGSDTFWKVPHNHLGKVEYFDFLRGNCYLISYGIDGIVFLFDIFEKKSIAYVKLESIISMALSPDENKVVCVESSGEMNVINLYRLKRALPPDFKLPSDFRLHAQINHQPQRTQNIAAPFPAETAGDEFIIDDDERMSFYSSESSDEDASSR
jgi:WD40 repeat protein